MIDIPYSALEKMFRLTGYVPSEHQRRVHEAALAVTTGVLPDTGEQGEMPTVVVVAGGEQGGKTRSAVEHVHGLMDIDELTWLVGNRYEDCSQEYRGIRDVGVRVGLIREKEASYAEDGPWKLRFTNGHELEVLSSEDVTKVARRAPNGIVMCEPGRQTREAFESCYRRIGIGDEPGWMLVCGTFEDAARWYPELYEEGLSDNPYKVTSLSIPTYSNLKRFPRGELDPRFRLLCDAIRKEHPVDGEDIIMERLYGVPRKKRGLVFWDFSRQIHVSNAARYIPGIEVSLAVDPGYGNAFAVLFIQVVQGQVRIFDEIYMTRTRGGDIRSMIKNHESFPDLDHIVLDVASTQHGNAQDSAFETWTADFGPRGISVDGRYVKLIEGIRRVHDKLAMNVGVNPPAPWLIVNPRCKMTIFECTEGYRYHVKTATGEISSEEPIDEHNHAVKALGYWIVDRYGYSDVKHSLPKQHTVRHSYDVAFARR